MLIGDNVSSGLVVLQRPAWFCERLFVFDIHGAATFTVIPQVAGWILVGGDTDTITGIENRKHRAGAGLDPSRRQA